MNLIPHPTESHWRQLREQCFATPEDLAHLNAYSYNGMLAPDGYRLVGFLRRGDGVVLVQEGEDVIGFISHNRVIPHHGVSLGMVIGVRYAGRGYGKRALGLWLEKEDGPIHAFCHQGNLGMIGVLWANGFVADDTFADPLDTDTRKFSRVPGALCR